MKNRIKDKNQIVIINMRALKQKQNNTIELQLVKQRELFLQHAYSTFITGFAKCRKIWNLDLKTLELGPQFLPNYLGK